MSKKINDLNQRISLCTKCNKLITPLQKTAVTNRGGLSKVMIIGRNPGNKETTTDKPFSGPSGVKLDKWLVGCGNKEDDPRAGIYFTSIVKCFCGTNASLLKKMAINCHPLLEEQINLIKPELVITLGEDAYEQVKFVNYSFNEALFKLFHSSSEVLLTKLNYHFSHLVWPHPSPLSRVLNDSDNQVEMEKTYKIVQKVLKG